MITPSLSFDASQIATVNAVTVNTQSAHRRYIDDQRRRAVICVQHGRLRLH